jgi:hypothetical protein
MFNHYKYPYKGKYSIKIQKIKQDKSKLDWVLFKIFSFEVIIKFTFKHLNMNEIRLLEYITGWELKNVTKCLVRDKDDTFWVERRPFKHELLIKEITLNNVFVSRQGSIIGDIEYIYDNMENDIFLENIEIPDTNFKLSNI